MPLEDIPIRKAPEDEGHEAKYITSSSKARNEGRIGLKPPMLKFQDAENIPASQRLDLVKQSTTAPSCLLGWQIEVDEGEYAGLHVVTGIKKNFFKKSFYRLSSYHEDDVWVRYVRLQRMSLMWHC